MDDAPLLTPPPPDDQSLRRRNLLVLLVPMVVLAGMLVFPWFYAPLFRHVCGLVGVELGREQNPAEALARLARDGVGKERADADSSLVNFMGVSGQLPLDIRPLERRMWVKTGDVAVVLYRLTNLTDRQLDYRAIHMVLPKSDTSFELLKCFCEDHRILKAGASEDLPLAFRLTKAVPGDAGLTVNYTIFDYAPAKNRAPGPEPRLGFSPGSARL
jgi:cytochrome c oxidase assembly protein Cox11